MKLSINKSGGGSRGNVEVSDAAFAREFNQSLIHQVVTAHLAGARAGTRAQKNRARVRGGGAKPWRQKGTGRARAGTIRSNIFRGGGRAFPAAPRDFSQKVNRKMYRAAMRSILSELTRSERLVVVDTLALDTPKTKLLLAMLKTLNATEALLVLPAADRNIELAARNLKTVSVCSVAEIDPVNLLGHDKILMTADAIKLVDEAHQK